MKTAIVWILILTTLAGTLACAPQQGLPASPAISSSPVSRSPGPSQSVTPSVVASNSPQPLASLSPTTVKNDLSILVDGNNAFALDLYHKLGQQEGNLFYSPYSISLALAMAYGGARGETAQQMADALHFNLPDETIHSTFQKLAQELNERNKTISVTVAEADKYTNQPVENVKLKIANAVWGQQNYPFLDSYIDLVKAYYDDEGLRQSDFWKSPAESRQIINDWISQQTQGKIAEMLPQGLIDSNTVMLLTNAVYFKAFWWDTFNTEGTKDEVFRLLDKSEVMVPMMTQQIKNFLYYEDEDCQAVAMPYLGRELSMIVVLPGEGWFAEFENSLSLEKLNNIIAGLKSYPVDLKFPRFNFESEYNLKDTLLSSGMTDAFSPQNADFSGLTREQVWMDEVIHQTFISVNERGTEAWAATVARILSGSNPFYAEFTANRPFIFLIRDNETGTILFLGRLVNPR